LDGVTTAEVLDHLRGRGLVVLKRRRGGLAQCPAHQDRRPSLDVTTGRDDRTLLYCRSGCRTEDVLAAAGLRLADLFAHALDAPVRARPRTALDAMRAEALALAQRQGWAQPGVVDRYAAADAIRVADRVRRKARKDDPEVWETLARAAALTTAAENVLAAEP
jgi:hypothetical protein